jgi:hypothetical protein
MENLPQGKPNGHKMTIWFALWPFDLFYGNLVYFVGICNIIPILVNCIQKNLATLLMYVAQKQSYQKFMRTVAQNIARPIVLSNKKNIYFNFSCEKGSTFLMLGYCA